MRIKIGLFYKLLIPLWAVLVISCLFIVLYSLDRIEHVYREGVIREVRITEGIVKWIESYEHATDATLEEQIKPIIDADIVVVEEGRETLTSLGFDDSDGDARARFLERVKAIDENPPPRGELVRFNLDAGSKYLAASGEIEYAVFDRNLYPTHDPAYERHGVARAYLLYDAAKIDNERFRTAWTVILGGAFACIVAGAIVFYVTRRVAGGVSTLVAKTEEIARGNFDEELNVNSRDELETLADSVNDMMKSLKQLQENLLAAERIASMGRMAATVAHEIKNPLSAIRMGVQVIESRASDDRSAKAIEMVKGEIDRLARYVDQTLSAHRPASGEKTEIDLSEVVADVLEIQKRDLEHRKAEVETGSEPGVPHVRGDRNSLSQVVLNLLLNAVQASGDAPRIEIKIAAAGGNVKLEIADYGGGIPEDAADKVFEPFFSTRSGGSGLGLAISREIVEEHGGTIGFISAEGRTVFTVELPAWEG